MASLSSVGVRKSLPGRLPLLLIGSGLANSSLARTLSLHGYSSPDQHFRLFDQHSAHHQSQYALNLQSWATDGLDHLIRRGRPKHGDQPGFVHVAAVDAQHGGKGGVKPQLFDIKSDKPVADIQGVSEGTDVMATQARVKSGVFLRSLKGNVDVEYDKRFVAFNQVTDESGREAVEAHFADGSSAIGSAIIAGDGLRSTVRSQLLPNIQPTVLPVVCYTGQWDLESSRAIMDRLEDGTVPAYNKRPTSETDTYTTWVSDGVAFAANYQYLDRPDARMQYIYARMAKGYKLDEATEDWVKDESRIKYDQSVASRSIADGQTGTEVAESAPAKNPDVLFNPERSLAEAIDIPGELFEEIKALREGATDSAGRYLDSVDAATNKKQYNWLMRTVKLPTDKQALDELKSKLPGGDKVFLIGDAAHAAPIFQGQGGSHSLYDGFQLGTTLARAFRTQSQPTHTQSSSGPSSSIVLDALNAFEASRLADWAESVEVAEGQLYDLFRPQAEWDAGAKALENQLAIDHDLREEHKREIDELSEWVQAKATKDSQDDQARKAYKQADWIETAEAREEKRIVEEERKAEAEARAERAEKRRQALVTSEESTRITP